MKRLNEALAGQTQNCLLPFFWMHGEDRDTLKAELEAVCQSGARAFCVESRTHDEFCRDGWWRDMDMLLEEAEKRGMRVWILDDKHFPTGFANGAVAEGRTDKRKWQLVEEHMDAVGPAREAMLYFPTLDPEDEVLGVYAYRRRECDEALVGEAIELTDKLRGNFVTWDIPEGVYRAFILKKSRRGGRADYIHLIDPESVRVLIDEVYEPHYAHYARYFGNTLAGFFSDEPSMGNARFGRHVDRGGMYDQRVGQPGVAFPWTDELLIRMNASLGRDARGLLPRLWYESERGAADVRVAYMDELTKLWREAFSYQLGDWCRSHGVEYIGHIIEDMNAHARLSCSAGHFFRSLDGQDMAGIDIVLHQIVPGLSHYVHAAAITDNIADPEFFDYVLAKLAASHAHLQPRMKGRAMCEVFGAYGWAEHAPMMKSLMDHLLVRGVNQFVPHAFSPKYPDPDCPPHFNAHGENPQFSAFARLMHYTQKVSHLLSGSVPLVNAGILYHAEAEWAGGEYMLTQKPAKALYDAQLDYAILPVDSVTEARLSPVGALLAGEYVCPCLVVPRAQYLPKRLLERLGEMCARGLRVLFVDARPENCDFGMCVPLTELASAVRALGGESVCLDDSAPLLHVGRFHGEDGDAIMFVNEDAQPVDVWASLPLSGACVKLDWLLDEQTSIDAPNGRFRVTLEAGQSTILVFSENLPALPTPAEYVQETTLAPAWTVALEDGTTFAMNELHSVSRTYPEYSGTMTYSAKIHVDRAADTLSLDLGEVGVSARAYWNAVCLGERICKPYRFALAGAVKDGENELRVVVSNTLVNRLKDPLSRFIQIPASGLLGPVKLLQRAGTADNAV